MTNEKAQKSNTTNSAIYRFKLNKQTNSRLIVFISTEHLQASTYAQANSTESETNDSNIDSRSGKMVNVFLTRPVWVLACHGWLIVRGRVLSDSNRKNRFAVSMSMQNSQSVLQCRSQTDNIDGRIMHCSLLLV